MMNLLAAELSDKQSTASSLCQAGFVPSTTARRWMNALEQNGLIIRRTDQIEPGTDFVELSPRARDGLDCYFADLNKFLASDKTAGPDS